MAPVAAGERALVLGLELVVELLHHPLLQFLRGGLRIEARRERLGHPEDEPGVLHVGGDGLRHSRVLHLHRDPPAVAQHRSVHLPDRGGGGRVVLEVFEQLLDRLLPLLIENRAHLLPRHRWRGRPERCEPLLIELAVLGRKELGVDEGGELADLQRRPLHAPQGVNHLLRGLEVTPLDRLRGLLGRSGDVGRARAGVAGSLSPDHRPDLSRAPEPSRRDRAVAVLRHPGARICRTARTWPSRLLALKQSARTWPSRLLALKQSARSRPSRLLAAGMPRYTGQPSWPTASDRPSPSRSAPNAGPAPRSACAARGSSPAWSM